MSVDLAALKSEIQNDPAGLGLAPFVATGNNGEIAYRLNQIVSGSSVTREFITAPELQGALDATEFTAFNAAFMSRWQAILMTTMSSLPINTGNLKAQLLAMFPNAVGTSASRTSLIALQTKQGTRAEVLFGDGTVISTDDVYRALL